MTLSMLLLVGRWMIAAMFLQSGYSKLSDFGATEKMMTHFRFPMPRAALIGAIVIELGGGTLLLFGLADRPVSLALIGFIVLASIMIPGKLILNPEKRAEGFRVIFTNIALIGALLRIVSAGA
jgi:putative oxidoreductase